MGFGGGRCHESGSNGRCGLLEVSQSDPCGSCEFASYLGMSLDDVRPECGAAQFASAGQMEFGM